MECVWPRRLQSHFDFPAATRVLPRDVPSMRHPGFFGAILLCIATASLGCRTTAPGRAETVASPSVAAAHSATTVAASVTTSGAVAAEVVPESAVVIVADPVVLERLEHGGF